MTDSLARIDDEAPQPEGAFGEGGQAPYERALQSGATGVLRLQDAAALAGASSSIVDVARFTSAADAVDAAILERCDGPVIDLSCGPGRMVRAAVAAGRVALGIDVSASAVDLMRGEGLPVLRASVFDALPREGAWGQALLLDGNLGIGGDVARLARRAVDLVRPDGVVVIEAHRDRRRDRHFDAVLVDEHGRRSEPFPWAELGVDALVDTVRRAGLEVSDRWTSCGRTFVEVVASRPRPRAA